MEGVIRDDYCLLFRAGDRGALLRLDKLELLLGVHIGQLKSVLISLNFILGHTLPSLDYSIREPRGLLLILLVNFIVIIH